MANLGVSFLPLISQSSMQQHLYPDLQVRRQVSNYPVCPEALSHVPLLKPQHHPGLYDASYWG
jgi:hypothetical protein